MKEKIRNFIIDTFLFGTTDRSFADDVSFLESGIIDSTGMLEIVSFVEEHFSIEVQDKELIPDNFDSLNNLCNYIVNKLEARNSECTSDDGSAPTT